MKRSGLHTYMILLISIFLSGCMYPKEQLAKNQIPHQDQLEMVERAVNAYIEQNNGLVPIQTKTSYTSEFEKYPIDFDRLREQNLLSEIPGNAFENGGIYQYVIITPEENPRVRLIDLRLSEALQKLAIQIDAYRTKEIYPPFGEEIVQGLYKINYERLGLKSAPYVTSPYSRNHLPVMIDTEGVLYIDYRIDLLRALSEFDHEYEEGDDIRYLIADHTPFALPYSLPYTIEDREPVFMIHE